MLTVSGSTILLVRAMLVIIIVLLSAGQVLECMLSKQMLK